MHLFMRSALLLPLALGLLHCNSGTNSVAVTLCGHTHGGQVNFPIVGPVIANERFGRDLVYGHTIAGDRHIVISAGLGTSILPIRFMRPPELVELTISGAAPATA